MTASPTAMRFSSTSKATSYEHLVTTLQTDHRRLGGGSGNRTLNIYVLSQRCREPIAGQVDLFNELSRTEDEGDGVLYAQGAAHLRRQSLL